MVLILSRISTIIGCFASSLGLIFIIRSPKQPWTLWQGILLGSVICFFLAAVILSIIDYFKRKPKSLRKVSQIRDYMYKWISRGGRVAIFTHDMSWVRDDRMKDMLRSKARRNELSICLPQRIQFVEELASIGAKIYDYPDLQLIPKSRFTIINMGRHDSQVAVGKSIRGKHLIEEFSIGEHPIFFVANDLVEVVMRYNQL